MEDAAAVVGAKSLPILSDLVLRDHVRALLPGTVRMPDAVAARMRMVPARLPSRGDVGTDAALLAARFAGVPSDVFAAGLAARLAGPHEVHVDGRGFISLSYSREALDGVLPALLGAGSWLSPSSGARLMALPVATMRHLDADFMVQYAHARCQSVLRAAADMPGLGGHDPSVLAAASAGWFVSGPSRALLSRLEHWTRLTESLGHCQDGRRITLFLHDLSRHFEQLWKSSREHATLRFLYPEQRSRSLANLALVVATAGVIRSGLERLAVGAIEEIG